MFKEEEEAIRVDLHEGCGRTKLFWVMALADSKTLKAMVEFRESSKGAFVFLSNTPYRFHPGIIVYIPIFWCSSLIERAENRTRVENTAVLYVINGWAKWCVLYSAEHGFIVLHVGDAFLFVLLVNHCRYNFRALLTRCNRTRQRPGPDNDHTIWSFSGPEILGLDNDVGAVVVWS